MHAHAQLDIPAAGVHKVVVQDGTHVSVVDATVPTTVASEEQTTKVFDYYILLLTFMYTNVIKRKLTI